VGGLESRQNTEDHSAESLMTDFIGATNSLRLLMLDDEKLFDVMSHELQSWQHKGDDK
jgi:hypothetical protein